MSKSGIKLLDNGRLHAVKYIFEDGLTIKELEEKNIVRLKSGISSRLTQANYRTETIRTDSTGKRFLMWDSEFIDQNLSFEHACEVIQLMDRTFKQIMKNEGYQSRSIHLDRSIGTEWYELDDKDSLIEIIESTWNKSYRIAYEFVTKTELKDNLFIESFVPRPNQDTLFIDPLVEHFVKQNKATAQSHGGTGKTKMSFRVSEIVTRNILKSPWKTLTFSDTIPNTTQLAYEFAKFFKGQTGNRLMDIYVIGSASTKDYRLLAAWANVIPMSNKMKVKKAIETCYNSKKPAAFFVVNKSANKFLSLAKELNIDFTKWFTILDEIQQYANETDQPKSILSASCAVVSPKFNSLFGKKLGLSATHICRGENCTDPEAVFNDDISKFGPRVVDIGELTARKLGWISDKQGVIIPLPTSPEFLDSLQSKRPFEITDLGIQIYPQHFVAVEGLVKYILPQNKSHILILSTFIKDITLLCALFRGLQKAGKIDKDYEIIEGHAKCGNSCVNQFNRSKKAIMVATRWIGVGQDTFKCDCTFPLYNPSSRSFARQFSMRGDRVYNDKVSLLAFVELESRLQDSIWFEALENIANGEVPNIISEAEFREVISREIIGSNRNPSDGRSPGNVTVVRSTNNDPIVFDKWATLASHISSYTYTDSNGSSKFSDIFNGIYYTEQKCIEEASNFTLYADLLKYNGYICKLINEYGIENEAYAHMQDWFFKSRANNVDYFIEWLQQHQGKSHKEISTIKGPVKIDFLGTVRYFYGGSWHLSKCKELNINYGEILNLKGYNTPHWDKEKVIEVVKQSYSFNEIKKKFGSSLIRFIDDNKLRDECKKYLLAGIYEINKWNDELAIPVIEKYRNISELIKDKNYILARWLKKEKKQQTLWKYFKNPVTKNLYKVLFKGKIYTGTTSELGKILNVSAATIVNRYNAKLKQAKTHSIKFEVIAKHTRYY
jgi:hypothetical protein